MTFAEYSQIMREHGIGELCFQYTGKHYSIFYVLHNLNLRYTIYYEKENAWFDNLDDLFKTKIFDGKCLEDIWSEIQILEIDGVSEKDYDVKACSFDYITYLKEQGEVQWSCSLGRRKSFFIQLKYAVYGMLIFLLPMMLFPILHLSNWKIFYLFGGVAAFTLSIASLAIWKNKLDINYQITTKKIFVNNGLPLSTSYDNIKKVKLKRSIFNNNIGTVKLYLKKGWSINYSLLSIPECEKVYNMILENI